MSDLRLILLLIGGLFVIGIYCWEVFFRSSPKRKDTILDAVDDIPDVPGLDLRQTEDSQDYTSSLVDLGNMIAQSRNDREPVDTASPFLLKESDDPDAFPAITDTQEEPVSVSMAQEEIHKQEKSESVFTGVDIDLFEQQEKPVNEIVSEESLQTDEPVTEPATDTGFSSSQEEENDQDDFPDSDVPAAETEQARELGQACDELIVLYITSPAQTMFNGLSISKAADEVGMVYGHMNIFHHFGPGKLHSGQPLFSMANMYEPGAFDLGRMADLRTKGVVLFMYSPASIEAKVVFELFLNTSRRIAELINGELRTRDNQALSSSIIQSLRSKAESLSNMD